MDDEAVIGGREINLEDEDDQVRCSPPQDGGMVVAWTMKLWGL